MAYNMKKYLFALAASWLFIACVSKQDMNESAKGQEAWSDSLVIVAGDRIVAETFDTLRQSLMSAIQEKGVSGAIPFCSENAVSLTTAYADTVAIRRTALRVRNPQNAPDSLETYVLQSWQGDVRSDRTPVGKVVRTKGQIHYFKPIMMQALCMNCHGAPQLNIQPATLSAIKERYPDDLAIDFVEGELRGSWHLIFDQEK